MALKSFECDCCGATYTGSWIELGKLGWVRHSQGKGVIVLCRDCEVMFAARRLMKKKLKEAA